MRHVAGVPGSGPLAAGLVLACTLFAACGPIEAAYPTGPEILSDLVYYQRNRGFPVRFDDPGVQGWGHQHMAVVPGSDANGRYLDAVLEEVDVPVTSASSGPDGWTRTTPPKAILLDAGCGEHNCVLYRGKPLFGQRDTGPIDPPQWSDPNSVGVYGWYGYTGDRRKIGMEVALPEPASLSLLALGGVAAMRRGRTRR